MAFEARAGDEEVHEDWVTEAGCRDVPTSDFYEPTPSTAAVEACRQCRVRTACLHDELATRPPLDEVAGYRAGMMADERRALLVSAARTQSDAARRERVARVRTAIAAGVRASDVAVAEGVDRRTIARWLEDRDSSTLAQAG